MAVSWRLIPRQGFNSKLVRLKGWDIRFASACQCLFQFQTGAIKRLSLQARLSSETEFQFQTGAIKSASGYGTSPLIRCFNSKLVRLKGHRPLHRRAHSSRFNSKLVRLKDNFGRSHVQRVSMFQFQTGAIKRRDWTFPRGPPSLGFNSKLVRLKDKPPVYQRSRT